MSRSSSSRASPGRLVALALLGALVLTALVLAVEIVLAVNAEYLPTEPALVIDRRVGAGRQVGAGRLVGPDDDDDGGPPLRLAVLGDSTAAGVGAAGVEQSLPVQVAERVAAQQGRPVEVVGLGLSGARMADVTTRQAELLEERAFDVVLVVVGSNDATHVTPPWAVEEQATAMLRAVRDASGGAEVVLGGVPEFTTVPALAQPLRGVVGRYAGVVREGQRRAAAAVDGVRFVDIAAEASPRFLGVPESMSSDGFHPSAMGYGFWADALAPVVVEAAR